MNWRARILMIFQVLTNAKRSVRARPFSTPRTLLSGLRHTATDAISARSGVGPEIVASPGAGLVAEPISSRHWTNHLPHPEEVNAPAVGYDSGTIWASSREAS